MEDRFGPAYSLRQPTGAGTWLVSWKPGRIRLLDVERETVVWEQVLPRVMGTPMFSPDGRFVSIAVPEGRDRQAVWIHDAATGQPQRLAVRFPAGFIMEFRANWTPDARAFVVTRAENESQAVLFDRFWISGQPDR